MSSDAKEHDELLQGESSYGTSSMDDFIKKIFTACDKDQDGYLDRSDLEEVRKQIGLEGNISEILEQFGASESGKISYTQFCENSAVLFGELNQSSSDSSPEYNTDSDTQPSQMATDKVRNKKEESTIEPISELEYLKKSDLDIELEVSREKIKQISAAWTLNPHVNPHRKSGGGIQDYLDQKTLQHLEELKIIDPPALDKTYDPALENVKKVPMHQDLEMGRETSGPDYLEMSKRLHLAALTSYKNEIYQLNSRLHQVRQEREQLRKQQSQWNSEKQRMQHDFENKLQSQTMRITELQSVIAELTRKLNKANGSKIIEEEEDEEGAEDESEDEDDDARSGSTSDLEVQGSHACSECSCENCDHQLEDEGPNQINFLATTHENNATDFVTTNKSTTDASVNNKENNGLDENYDLQQQLSLVLGALESTIEDRKNSKVESELKNNTIQPEEGLVKTVDNDLKKETSEITNMKVQLQKLLKQVNVLKKDKRSLEKQLHSISVQGYVYQKGNTAHVEDEFSKLRQDNHYLRSKLRKAEQELENAKSVTITIKEERDRLKKKYRALQEPIEGSIQVPSPNPSTGSTVSGHRRSHSTHLDQSPLSPTPIQRSSSVVVDTRTSSNHQQRSNSLDTRNASCRSPILHQRSSSETRKYTLPSPSHSIHSLPSHAASAFVAVNSKGYTISPEGSLRRGQHQLESSDLGSSIGDDSQKSELSKTLVRILRGRIPETLLHTIVTYHSLDQVLRTLVQHFLAEVEEKSKEAAISVECLESRIAHLLSQNDLLQLSLDECKHSCEKLSLLCGKYESNGTAWSLALQDTEQLIETFEVILQLQESEADIYAVNCHAAGIGNFDTLKSLTSTKSSLSNISMASSLASSSQPHIGYTDDDGSFKHSLNRRRDAESQAKLLLHKLDDKYENMVEEQLKQDDLSYKSRTSTGSSQNSANTDTLSKDEEHRLREYVKLLKTQRGTCKGTIVELESVNNYTDQLTENLPEERLERVQELNVLETAVVLQEMQALKEERAELKHRIYLIEKEKRALELKMTSREAQEKAYIVHIEHLKSEVKEQLRKRKQMFRDGGRKEDETLSQASSSTHSTNPTMNEYTSLDEIPADILEAARRERKLKTRMRELVETLEKLSKNYEMRQKETAEYISDLKRANGALVTAYEKAKKRHASRLRKFEQQLVQMAENYQIQVRALKEKISVLEETPASSHAPQTETSL